MVKSNLFGTMIETIMKHYCLPAFVLLIAFFTALPAHAQTDSPTAPAVQYFVAKIISGPVETEIDYGGVTAHLKTYQAEIVKGPAKGQPIELEQNDLFVSSTAIDVQAGDQVVVVQTIDLDEVATYTIIDAYRLPALIWAVIVFFLLAVIFGRLKGLTSIAGLALSAGVIVWFLVPRIVAGADPLLTSLLASLLIATVSLFVAHGFNKRTAIAYGGTIVTLIISALAAVLAVSVTHLFGMGSEESIFVLADLPNLSLKGLLLAGIMLGLLGVLDDITTAQSAVVEELKLANPTLTFTELYRRGLSVGREHIASLINTLFLAYAGASLPLFLLFYSNNNQALWMIFNNEMIAEEIVRTIVGSASLILAVPITTAFAAYVHRKCH